MNDPMPRRGFLGTITAITVCKIQDPGGATRLGPYRRTVVAPVVLAGVKDGDLPPPTVRLLDAYVHTLGVVNIRPRDGSNTVLGTATDWEFNGRWLKATVSILSDIADDLDGGYRVLRPCIRVGRDWGTPGSPVTSLGEMEYLFPVPVADAYWGSHQLREYPPAAPATPDTPPGV